jgi:hypothetical protein
VQRLDLFHGLELQDDLAVPAYRRRSAPLIHWHQCRRIEHCRTAPDAPIVCRKARGSSRVAFVKPKGFWSYARYDAADADGRMDDLHRLIQNELGRWLGLGEPVDVFFDKTAIPAGEQWETMIKALIAAVVGIGYCGRQ